MITIQNYVRAKSLEEAYELNQKKGTYILGGMLWLRICNIHMNTAVDLCDLGLDGIEETKDCFRICAMTTLRSLELHEGLAVYTGGAMKKAVENIVGVQFRNLATVGGSIWGRYGFSDVLTMFLSMDTYVELYHGGIIPLEQFCDMKYDRDLLVRVIIKKTPGCFAYTSMRNQSTDFPVLAMALSCIDDEYRLSVGARPGKAILLRDEKGLLKDGLTPEAIDAFAKDVAQRVPTGSNMRGSADYRSCLVETLCDRALKTMKGDR